MYFCSKTFPTRLFHNFYNRMSISIYNLNKLEKFILITLLHYLLFLPNNTCHPLLNDGDNKLEARDEKCFPNGTVIGKYMYMDSDGTPIQVKYYADEAGYGVELKTVKISNPSVFSLTTKNAKRANGDITGSTILERKDTNDSLSDRNRFLAESKIKNLFPEIVLDDNMFSNKEKENRKFSDYEVFFENEVNAPHGANKEKLRIYLQRNKRSGFNRDNYKSFNASVSK